jgi:hypothetical protein
MKTFTLEEARTLLPVLEALLRRASEAKQEAETAEGYLQELNKRIFLAGGMMVDVATAARQRAERTHGIQQAKDAVEEILSIGVQVKDIDTGLLDFPYKLEGEVVLLCWKMGEQDIEWWHSIEDGFGGRQPVDERFMREADKRGKGGITPESGKPN